MFRILPDLRDSPVTVAASAYPARLQEALLAVCLTGIAVPFIACVVFGGDFLDLANESIAYRYFFVVRVMSGETVVVGVGYLLAAIQQGIYSVISPVAAGPEVLRSQIQIFGLATTAVLTVAMGVVVTLAFRDRLLRADDKWLVGIVALVPMWATRITGFDYALMADYVMLNLVIVTAATWIFLREWRRGTGRTWRGLFVLGVGVGVAMANKVTLAVVWAPVLVPALVTPGVTVGKLARHLAVILAGVLSGFVLVVLTSYRFNPAALADMLPVWIAFVMNPGGESQFWDRTFSSFVIRNGYAATGVFLCLAVGLFVRDRRFGAWMARERVLLAVTLASSLAAVLFIVKRPAGSTLFESSVFLLAIGAMTLGTVQRLPRWLVPELAACWLLYGAVTFEWRESIDMIRLSRVRAQLKWDHYDDVRSLAGGRPITVVFPDNSFHHEGVPEFLLKGVVEFPTWHIGQRGQAMLALYAPGVQYRHDLGGPTPDDPYDSDTVVVWYESEGVDPARRYSALARAVGRCSGLPLEWALEGKAGQTHVIARACALTDGALAGDSPPRFDAAAGGRQISQ